MIFAPRHLFTELEQTDSPNLFGPAEFGLCLALASLLTFVTLSVPAVQAIPDPAAEYYGFLELHGEPAAAGQNVSSHDPSGLLCGQYDTRNVSYYGLLSCMGDDPETALDEGAVDLELISFQTNGLRAFITSGNSSWSSAAFIRVDLLGLKNISPYMRGCGNSTILEDTSGSQVFIDLWNCSYDGTDNISDLSFSIAFESNSSLIDCFVSANRYLTCNDPLADGNGISFVNVQTQNSFALTWTVNHSVNITPVNDSPRFLHNISVLTAREDIPFEYDVNCTDVDGDEIRYLDNTTLFDINSSTGLINFTPTIADFGNHSIRLTCDDYTLNTSVNFTLLVRERNLPPVLDPIGNQFATEGVNFVLTVTATDPDGDNLTFFDNTTLFEISPDGLISFIPSFAQIGNYSINISVSDGNFTDWEVINFTVLRGPYCGDNLCSGDESCSTCSIDCGICPEAPPSGAPESGGTIGGGSGQPGAGGGIASTIAAGPQKRAGLRQCLERWDCGEWTDCTSGVQQRECRDLGNCGTEVEKPEDIRVCEEPPVPPGDSCFDGIMNQNEEDIDCGGVCPPCAKKIFAELPIPIFEDFIRKIPRNFPWLLLLLILLIVSITMGGDQQYMRHLRTLPYDEYRERMHSYRKLRKRIYHTIFNLLIMTFMVSSYFYWFSNDLAAMRRYVPVLVVLVIGAPFLVAVLLKRLEFTEYQRQIAERRLANTHRRQTRHLTKMQTKMALDIEHQLVRHISEYSEEATENAFIPFKQQIFDIIEVHRTLLDYPALDEDTTTKLSNEAENAEFIKACAPYPELKQLTVDTTGLHASINNTEERIETERNFIDSMEDAAYDTRLKSIIASSDTMTSAYNNLVDVYTSITNLHKRIEESARSEQKLEAGFLESLTGFFQDKEIIEAHKQDEDFVRIYNLLVDLNDHFTKKQELNQ